MGQSETDSDTVEAEGETGTGETGGVQPGGDETGGEATSTLTRATEDADSSFSRDREVDSSTEPCPLAKSITGRFEEEEAISVLSPGSNSRSILWDLKYWLDCLFSRSTKQSKCSKNIVNL